MMKNLLVAALFFGSMIAGPASAGIILSTGAGSVCNTVHVNATGYGDADKCIGLLDKTSSGSGPNDSEAFLNNTLTLDDTSSTVLWGNEGAFGKNDWDFLGKDEQTAQTFINATSGDPGTWSVDLALNGRYVIAIKQKTELGLWYFDDLVNVTAGQLFIDNIFSGGTTDDGWSHVSIYQSAASVAEPSVIALLGAGLLGLGLVRRRKLHR